MDYRLLKRKQLQALCKLYRIPANKTNVFMGEALHALLNAPQDREQKMASVPCPAEVKLRVRLNRAAKSKKVAADVLEANNVSSHLAKSTTHSDFKYFRVGAVAEVKIEVRLETPLESANVPELEQTMDAMPEPAEVVKSETSPKPAVRSNEGADVWEGRAVNDLSSEFAKCTLAADSEYVRADEAGIDIVEAVAEGMMEVPPDVPRESDSMAEQAESPSSLGDVILIFLTPAWSPGPWSTPPKALTKALTQSAKANTESSSAASVFFTPAWSPGPWSTPPKALIKALMQSAKANTEWSSYASVFFTPAWSPDSCGTRRGQPLEISHSKLCL